jgi:hypothetical protein
VARSERCRPECVSRHEFEVESPDLAGLGLLLLEWCSLREGQR